MSIPSPPSYITLESLTSSFIRTLPSDPQMNPLLTSYYTVVYKSILSGSFYEVFNNTLLFFEHYFKRFEQELIILRKIQAETMMSNISKYGHLSGKGFNHRLYKTINDLIHKETVDTHSLSIKYKDQFVKEFISFVSEMDKLYNKANDLYIDIFKKDIKITADAHLSFIDYLSTRYNAIMEQQFADGELRAINAEIDAERVKNIARGSLSYQGELAAVEAYKSIADAEGQLSNRQLQMAQQMATYMNANDRVRTILSEAKARSLSSHAELLSSLVSATNSFISMCNDGLEILARSNSINNNALDNISRLSRIYNELFEFAKDILYSDYTSSRAQLEAQASSAKAQVSTDNLSLLASATQQKIKDIYLIADQLINLSSAEIDISRYVGSVEAAMSVANAISRFNDTIGSFYLTAGRSAVDAEERIHRISTDLTNEYKRMEIAAFAKIVASFIRNYT